MPTRQTKTILIAFILGLVAFWGCGDNSPGSEIVDEVLTIEITEESFLPGSASVWFSPSTGEITGTGENETPPDVKYIYWVEPNDPEFQALGVYDTTGSYGVKYVGLGSDYFNEIQTIESGGYNPDLFEVGDFTNDNVFHIRDYDSECMIQIIEWIQNDNYLKFKWKKL